MGCTFLLRRVGETVSRFRAIFRVAVSATRPIRKPRPGIRPKNRVAFSRAFDTALIQGVSPTAGRKGTSPSAASMTTMATPQVEDGQRAGTSANKLALKEDGIDLLVMPSSLNDKLSLWCPRSVGQLRRLVKRRNELPRNSPSSSSHSSSRWLRNRQQTTRHRHWRCT